MATTHPHTDSPSIDDLAEVVSEHSSEVQQVYLAAHALVLATVPDLRYSVDLVDGVIGYGAHQHGYNGWGMAALAPHSRWVALTLLGGASLPDPDGVLAGAAKRLRYVRLRSAEQLATVAGSVERLLVAAVNPHSQPDSEDV